MKCSLLRQEPKSNKIKENEERELLVISLSCHRDRKKYPIKTIENENSRVNRMGV